MRNSLVFILLNFARAGIGFSIILTCISISPAQAPEVLQVDPPSWWTRSSMNPVRLMVRGKNLQGSRVQAVGRGLRIVSAPKVNENGTYIFVDAAIAPSAQSGVRRLSISSPRGTTSASFEILAPLNPRGRFQGFSPADVLYLIMIDRFSDGDQTNNDPPQSRGLYDRRNKFYYHGGDLQGIIDRLPYLKDLGVTALWLTPWYDNHDGL
ncbi:MAG TPA: cyclomaltodextrinase N-terminal domain-containing protein, partial [Pyrinomonadaceae bacterium]|nr:cyclomaltodextrinase N-terminal domain-containing protein [Pyrinomonadaceae bacterium]